MGLRYNVFRLKFDPLVRHGRGGRMYKLCKTEQSAKRQREIEQGLFEMMKSTSYDNVTVSALCESMNIPRKAFYRYFDSKEDALRAFVDHTMFEFDSYTQSESAKGKRSLVAELKITFDYWHERKDVLRAFERCGRLDIIFERAVRFPFADKITISRFLPEESDTEREWIFKFIASGITMMIFEWYRSGFSASSEQMAEIAKRIITKPLFSGLERIGIGE